MKKRGLTNEREGVEGAGATPPGEAHVSPKCCVQDISGEFEGGLVTPTCAEGTRPRGSFRGGRPISRTRDSHSTGSRDIPRDSS